MKPVLDIKKTLGQLNFLGVDEKYKYENGERTDKTVYAYKLASQEQGDFGTIAYSWNAEDIKVVGSNSALKQK